MKDAKVCFSGRAARLTIAACVLMVVGLVPSSWAQSGTNPLFLFKNYFVTGDYIVAGWQEAPPDGSGFAPGMISVPDTVQAKYLAKEVPTSVPVGADIVAAYLYWATVEGNQSTFAGQSAYFNGYAIKGEVLGNPNAPTSWSAGGCSGSANGSKTMRTYRADVHPYLPVDTNAASPTFGGLIAAGNIPVRLKDSGSNGNTQPNALGATLVVIYRVLNPKAPLNAIILYDGAYAPSNAGQTISQNLTGFYQPAASPVAKITHIVANGQPNKGETVSFGNHALQSLYTSTFGATAPAFPGLYNSPWDNPTWVVSNYVNGSVPGFDTSETTSVQPSATNSGCVSWGEIILSTTVQNSAGDGLLDVWKLNQGYSDVVRENDPPNGKNDPTSGQWVALPGASQDPNVKDLFVEVDWLNNLDGSAGPFLHTHLPKEAALDAVGNAFLNGGINVHFDLGPGVYAGDKYVIPYPLTGPQPQAGTGGKAISEGLLMCSDGVALCPFLGNTPGAQPVAVQPAVAWKGGVDFVQNFNNNPILGNFQPGRVHSYHYAFFGHSLGEPISFWSTVATAFNTGTGGNKGLGGIVAPQLTSITVTSANKNNTTITIQEPNDVATTPWDCFNLAAPPTACGLANSGRISIGGALGQPALNGTYPLSKANLSQSTINGITTTNIVVTTAGVTPGPYNYANEPQLGVSYLGPSSSSGHSDLGGGDSLVSLGLWGVDDPVGCQPDPTQPPGALGYCSNQVGTTNVQTGTLLHEVGHSLTLTHGGTYYVDPNNQSMPSYELNCKPNFLSVMSYLFQVRGFVDGGFDYSGQTMPPLSETGLSEFTGIGDAVDDGSPAKHLTRWYSIPNPLDQQLQAQAQAQNPPASHYATVHCDGSPLLPNEPPSVRVDGSIPFPGPYSAPLDWNNDLSAPDALFPPAPPTPPAGIDINHNGVVGDAPFSGLNDWTVLTETSALQQMSGRSNAFGLSGGNGVRPGVGGVRPGVGGVDDAGGGFQPIAGGVRPGVGGVRPGVGGIDQSEDLATSTVNSPSNLNCMNPPNNVPVCTESAPGVFLENAKSVPLQWTSPEFGQIRKYYVWRAVGSFTTSQSVLTNSKLFSVIATLSGAPPTTSASDSNVKNGVTYTYFITDQNKQNVTSGASTPIAVTVKF